MKKHILSVDDEQPIRELLQESLGLRGYRVSTAATLADGRKIAGADRPDLIILDVQFDESDGFVLVDEFKSLYPTIPILLLTGVVFDTDVLREAIRKKVAGYLDKTVPLSRILSEVHRLIGDAETAQGNINPQAVSVNK
jgi:DNA-binding NtrC family response regulator